MQAQSFSPRILLMAFVASVLASQSLAEDAESSGVIRIATFNASLYGKQAGDVRERLADGIDTQAQHVAAIVQVVRPDILLINEIDYEPGGDTARLLADKFFAMPQQDRDPIAFPYIYVARSNTGVDSGLDLNRDGVTGRPEDAWGYGVYPGQYSMAVFSRFPIDEASVRTFEKYLWKDLPGALQPMNPDSGEPYYDQSTWESLRLSSKNHIDVPIVIQGETLHVLASHPTPPVFDGAEDRNGCRNHDEIQFWVNYLNGASNEIVDDRGNSGAFGDDAMFVILGDLNSDPIRGDSRTDAIQALLGHRRLVDPKPQGHGPESATAQFGQSAMRVDYALPSRNLKLKRSGVFWPSPDSADHSLISASDHRLVWVEVELP